MRPRERRESGEQDLFRSRLDQIIDMNHALVKLAQAIDWRFLEERFGAVYTDKPGQPPLPTRLMAGLAILKHSYDLSDEALCDRWVKNPYFQYFCGEEFFRHALVFDRSSLTRWRQRMGDEKLSALLQESLAVASRTQAMKPSDLARVVIDTTVQPKAVMFPTDAKLLNRARERLVRLAKKLGVRLRQSYRRVGKLALIKHQRYAHAHQFKRANRSLRKLKTYLGRVIRDIERHFVGNEDLREAFARPLYLARRVLEQERRQRGRKVYSLHAPEVECIGKGTFVARYPDRARLSRPRQISLKPSSSRTTKEIAARYLRLFGISAAKRSSNEASFWSKRKRSRKEAWRGATGMRVGLAPSSRRRAGIALSPFSLTELESSGLHRRAENAVREISRRTRSACAIALAQSDSADPPDLPALSAHAASVFLNSDLAIVCGIAISQPLLMRSKTALCRRAG
jgi:hypothetical protein